MKLHIDRSAWDHHMSWAQGSLRTARSYYAYRAGYLSNQSHRTKAMRIAWEAIKAEQKAESRIQAWRHSQIHAEHGGAWYKGRMVQSNVCPCLICTAWRDLR